MEKNPFSLRLKSAIAQQFQHQAKIESLTQGDLFEKMFNLYLGKPLESESVPFNINLFWINKIELEKNLDKKIYEGYGVPLYVSDAFKVYGIGYYNDSQNKPDKSVFENANIYKRTELVLYKNSFHNLSWSKLDSEIKIQHFQRDFKIKNPQNYYYMSAFRVFKEIKNDLPITMVNEQMYLINDKRYSDLFAKSLSGAMSNNLNNDEVLFAKDFDLAVSTLHKINNPSDGEKILKLDRAYLNFLDRENLNNILKPTISKDDPEFERIVSEYAIFD